MPKERCGRGAEWKLGNILKPLGYSGRVCAICYVAQGPEEVGTQTSTAVGLRAIPYLAFGRGFILLHKSSVHFTYSGLLAFNINVHQLQNKLQAPGFDCGQWFVSRCAVDAYLG
jgi:hypothetical protein